MSEAVAVIEMLAGVTNTVLLVGVVMLITGALLVVVISSAGLLEAASRELI